MDILDRYPELVKDQDSADFVIVPVTRLGDFILNPAIEQIRKPYVIVDMEEMGWDWDQENTHVFGRNTAHYEWYNRNPQWAMFESWVAEHPPVCQFKRELLEKDRSDRLLPFEYLVFDEPPPRESRGQFDARPISVMYNWGRSSEKRVRLHADMFADSSRLGYEIISQFDHIDRFFHENPNPGRRVWCSVYAPSYARIRNEGIVELYLRSKISVAENGAGCKTFRDREIMNSVMARPFDKLAWTYDWMHGHNCIRYPAGLGVEVIYGALESADLYQIYQNALLTLDQYRPRNFYKNHFIPTVKGCMS